VINANPTATTSVQFVNSSGNAGEGDGSFDVDVSITNPDGTNATQVEVALISGDASDIGNYTTQTLTFPSGSSTNQTVTVTITDDSDIEGEEDFIFELQNVSGGNSATISSPSQFTLTITDNDIPNIIISEIMQNPNAVSDDFGEWFELYNDESIATNIDGWKIKDNGSDNHTIDNGGTLSIPSKGFIVLGNNSNSGTNGGLNVDYEYSSFTLANGDDEIILTQPDDTEIDRVEYDGGTNWPDPTGASMYYAGTALQDNNDGSKWSVSTIAWTGSDGDFGSPGDAGEGVLPVELSSFSASIVSEGIKLNWRTETEVSNYGFDVERQVGNRQSAVGKWSKIGFVEGYGNSNSPKEYSFVDNNISAGVYSYRLKQIDNDGKFEYSKVIEIDIGTPLDYELNQNYPNPFNPSTTIMFSIPEKGNVKLMVYNILGEEVVTLLDEIKEAGIHTINFNAAELRSGIYFYKLESGDFLMVKKMNLVK